MRKSKKFSKGLLGILFTGTALSIGTPALTLKAQTPSIKWETKEERIKTTPKNVKFKDIRHTKGNPETVKPKEKIIPSDRPTNQREFSLLIMLE